MEQKSIWTDFYNHNEVLKLENNLNTDVLVIGGGIAGILCAYELRKRNFKTIILEKYRMGRGTTKDTTAFITAQHEILYQDLYNRLGMDKAKTYLDINLQAVEEYQKLSQKYDFDFVKCNSTLFSTNKDLIKNEQRILRLLDYETLISTDIPLYEHVLGVTFTNQGMLNPIKLINALSKELTIYEHSEVVTIEENHVILKNNVKVGFNHLVICTHYPLLNISNGMFMKLTQRRSYVVALKKDLVKDTYCCLDGKGYYFRTYGDYLIIGGNDRDIKEGCLCDFTNKICAFLNITKDDIIYSWSGQDCITLDKIPYVGKCGKNKYLVTGFNLWGFTWAMASSKIIADMIEKHVELPLTKLKRKMLNKQLLNNLKTTVINFLKVKKPRCKHLGSALNYNEQEHVWECPCHGSRYDQAGKVLDGPTTKTLY